MRALFPAAACVATLVATTSAGAQGLQGGLLWLTGEIRAEAAVLDAQARQLLIGCRDARDVANELDDLSHDLDRLERELRRPLRRAFQLERLASLAQRVDREACDLQEEVGEAVDALARRQPPRRQRLVLAPHRFERPGRGGLTIRLGGGGPRLVLHSGGRARGVAVPAAAPVGPAGFVGQAPPPQGFGPDRFALQQLTVRADRVRLLTQELVAVLSR